MNGILTTLLIPPAAIYASALRLRNLWYDRVASASIAPSVPAISVGNITTGGTGKTPLVIEIATRLVAWGRRPAILTRGYRGTLNHPADEVRELQAALPDVPVVVDPDRVRGAAAAVGSHAADCLILDDGFQHRRLRRALDLLVIDVLDPWGGGHVLPAGRLREPVSSLRRASAIVISRANLVERTAVERIARRVEMLAPGTPIMRAAVRAAAVQMGEGPKTPDALAQRPIVAVCGIGNPESFLRLIQTCGADVRERLTFPDHHAYTDADARRIADALQRVSADAVVTTRKDWVKLADRMRSLPAPPPLWRLDISLELDDPDGQLDRLLRQALATQPR